ncbi:hypothetical protein [Butyrivibrio sp. INlla16]|uniref:hypothetical protein n=1 Tax=Butyrivibrio sp. INlla16 TaxID=1520807 RepID=UPI000891D42C|nr:hypothetical protein [Butyrivibrio sp. INlla16]SDB52920.1 hypothetical protein SAMN02910263_02667 [Butyrivibrio sp. INlla16]
MKKITAGDIMHVYGSFGQGSDYSVRLVVRMEDEVDGDILRKSVESAANRYPYLLLRMKRDDNEIFYEDNDEPIAVLNQKERVTLGAKETGYHMWAVCYFEDKIFLDFYHGLCDGTGMYMVLSTMLYYYTKQKYGDVESEGIRTLDDEITPDEYLDPLDQLPEIDISNIPSLKLKPAFSLVEDGGFTPCEQRLFDVVIPEKDFLKFSSANDASPGVMVSILLARTIDRLFPDRDKGIMGSYIINARPMLHAPNTHHNCVNTVFFDYSDKIKAMPFDRQCTAYRGKTFIQSDEERIQKTMTVSASRNKAIAKATPTVEAKMQTYGMMLSGGRKLFTCMVSYVGKWKYPSVGKHIKEFWTHVPNANGLLVEIAAVNGKIFLTMHQNFEEDTVVRAFEKELTENGISFETTEMLNDVAHMELPEKV